MAATSIEQSLTVNPNPTEKIMHALRCAALAAALAFPLASCASGSLSLDPNDLHAAVNIGSEGYSIFCGVVGNSDYCSKADRKIAKRTANGVNGAIDTLPSQ